MDESLQPSTRKLLGTTTTMTALELGPAVGGAQGQLEQEQGRDVWGQQVCWAWR
jgi:hypothetical protein